VRPQRRLRAAVPGDLPGAHRHPALPGPGQRRQLRSRRPGDQGPQSLPVGLRPGLSAPLRGGVPAEPGRRAGGDQLRQAVRRRLGPVPRGAVDPQGRRAHRQADRGLRRRSVRFVGGLLRRDGRPRRDRLRAAASAGRDDALRHPGIPPAQGHPRPRDRDHRGDGRQDRVRQGPGHPDPPGGSAARLRRGLPGDRVLAGHAAAPGRRERRQRPVGHRIPGTGDQGHRPAPGRRGGRDRRWQHRDRLRPHRTPEGRRPGQAGLPAHRDRDAGRTA